LTLDQCQGIFDQVHGCEPSSSCKQLTAANQQLVQDTKKLNSSVATLEGELGRYREEEELKAKFQQKEAENMKANPTLPKCAVWLPVVLGLGMLGFLVWGQRNIVHSGLCRTLSK
jgi:hypothetical protein